MQQIAIDYHNKGYTFSKWTLGETYEKTKRVMSKDDNAEKQPESGGNISSPAQKTTTAQAPHESELQGDDFSVTKTEYTRLSNKRNTHNELLLKRDPII